MKKTSQPTQPKASSRMQQQISTLKGQLRAQSAVNVHTGTMVVCGKEYLTDVTSLTSGPHTGYNQLYPGLSGCARLDSFAGLFELYRFKRCSVSYKAAVGSTVNGIVHVGVDFDASDFSSNIVGIASHEPVMTTQVWKNSSLSVPVDRLNKGKWMYTAINAASVLHPELGAGGLVEWGTNHVGSTIDVGELWLDYEVEFASPVLSNIQQAVTVFSSLAGKFAGGAGGAITVQSATLDNAQQWRGINSSAAITSAGQLVPVPGTTPTTGFMDIPFSFSGLPRESPVKMVLTALDQAGIVYLGDISVTTGSLLGTAGNQDLTGTDWLGGFYDTYMQSSVDGVVSGLMRLIRPIGIADASSWFINVVLTTIGSSPVAHSYFTHLPPA